MPTRRVFLKSSGLSLVSFGVAPGALVRAAEEGALHPRGRTLVVVFQRGACDGLNTLVPYGEASYASARPRLAIPRPGRGRGDASALDLDGFFGLHPALEPLMPLWKAGRLAALHAVGSPHATRSHFDAQDFMETGTPGVKSTRDGWMSRHLQAGRRPDDEAPLRAVALTPTLPRSLSGAFPALAMSRIDDFVGAGAAAARSFERLYAGEGEGALGRAGREAFEAVALLKEAGVARHRPANGAVYPRGPFGESLRQVAVLIEAGLGLEMAFVEIGGWDHHAGEGGVTGALAGRLRELAVGLAAFDRDLGGRMRDVVLVTLTEFGRTVRENGTRGTDHGHGAASFVLGGPVRGGRVLGRWPGLAPDRRFEGRDLAVTTDFRDLLAELLARHLGARDLGTVFPGHATGPERFPGVL